MDLISTNFTHGLVPCEMKLKGTDIGERVRPPFVCVCVRVYVIGRETFMDFLNSGDIRTCEIKYVKN